MPFPFSTGHCLLCHLTNEVLFEPEQAPFLGEHCVTAVQSDQEEVGQDRQRHRAFHACGLPGHLHLAQVHPAFQLLYREFHTPPPGVYTEDSPCARLGKIGHDDLHFFRPIVTPFLRKYNRDIAQIMERSAADKDPVILPAAVGFVARR